MRENYPPNWDVVTLVSWSYGRPKIFWHGQQHSAHEDIIMKTILTIFLLSCTSLAIALSNSEQQLLDSMVNKDISFMFIQRGGQNHIIVINGEYSDLNKLCDLVQGHNMSATISNNQQEWDCGTQKEE